MSERRSVIADWLRSNAADMEDRLFHHPEEAEAYADAILALPAEPAAGRARRMLVEALVDGGLPEKAAEAHVAAFEAEARAAALEDTECVDAYDHGHAAGRAAALDEARAAVLPLLRGYNVKYNVLAAIDALRERSGE